MSSGLKGLRIEWLPGAAVLWVTGAGVEARVGVGICLEETVWEAIPRLRETQYRQRTRSLGLRALRGGQLLLLYLLLCGHIARHACEGQRTAAHSFFPLSMWAWRLQFRLSSLCVKGFSL